MTKAMLRFSVSIIDSFEHSFVIRISSFPDLYERGRYSEPERGAMDLGVDVLYFMLTMAAGSLVFLHCGHYPECVSRVDKHFEGYYTLQYMSRGAVELYYGAERHVLRGSWFWTAYPGVRIRFHAADDPPVWHHRYVAFRGDLVERWREEGLYPIAPQPAAPGKSMAGVFDEMLESVKGTGRWNQMRAVNLLERMLIELAADRAQTPVREPWLETVLGELAAAENTFEPDYAQLADECGMGLSTLRRRFRAAMGMALHEYVMGRRVASARTMLGETEMPIKQVAERLGYRDVYFFSRQFRKVAGISPGAYRRSRQG